MAQGIIQDAYLKEEHAAALNASYSNAQPCKYLVMENFFTEEIANDLFENFPSIQDLNVKRKSLNEDKSEDYHFERWHPSFAKIREAVSSEEWYAQLSRITGIGDCTQPQTPWARVFTKVKTAPMWTFISM
jgi:hypothetical protein